MEYNNKYHIVEKGYRWYRWYRWYGLFLFFIVCRLF